LRVVLSAEMWAGSTVGLMVDSKAVLSAARTVETWGDRSAAKKVAR